jgi:N-acetylglucosamine kinase-like BadF-type ATPase
MEAKNILIADSGSSKADWCLLTAGKEKIVSTQGISPYFLNVLQIRDVLRAQLLPALNKETVVHEIYYYGTGCASSENVDMIGEALHAVFPAARLFVTHDLMGAARATCGDQKGVVSILGTGSSACFFDGEKIAHERPGLGYILGDEGSGTYLGKKVLQYYLYNTFDEELKNSFEHKFTDSRDEILDHVYKKPMANRYIASFSPFLSENRGHFMIENIIEDGLNDFFFNHIFKYTESWKYPIHFVGSIAWVYQDVVREICLLNELELGKIISHPMEGLIAYHSR